MRIGLFTDTYTPDINGVVSSIVTLQRELEKNGHDVYVITNHKAMTMKKEGNVLRLPGLERNGCTAISCQLRIISVPGMKSKTCIWM